MRIALTAPHYLPAPGGLQQSVHQLAHRLIERGHEIVVLAGVQDPRAPRTLIARAVRKVGGRPVLITDRRYGYPVWRAIDPVELMPQVSRRFGPDVVVVNIGGVTTFAFTRAVLEAIDGLPHAVYLRDVEAVALLGDPLVHPDEVVTNARRITDLVEATASPAIPFVFLETWPIDRGTRAELERRAQALGNVELRRVQHDPRRIYADARILLAPYDDSRPRVVAEAQANGIPVLAANVGGLVEGVGPGGLFVDLDAPVEAWAENLDRLWNDAELYRSCSAAARAHAGREEMRPERLAEHLEEVLLRILARRPPSASA